MTDAVAIRAPAAPRKAAARSAAEGPPPPHSINAEQAIIGSLLIGPATWRCVADILQANDFFRPDHRLIFEAISVLADNGKPTDFVTVSEHLERSGSLEAAGGIAYLGTVARETPTAVNVRSYAEIVAERAAQRRLQGLGTVVDSAIAEGFTSSQIVEALQSTLGAMPTKRGFQMRAFTATEILAPIEAEQFLLPGIPADAYTLVAGGLSSFKTTLLLYLLIWKATGWDVLGLDDAGNGIDIGKAVLISYEDTDRRILTKLQRVIQDCQRLVLKRWGADAAREFIERGAANLRRITLAGEAAASIVHRVSGVMMPNRAFLETLTREVRSFAPAGALIGIDPLRLAVSGVSQNDDDGADVVVHTLNALATRIPGSGLIVCSHANKAEARDPTNGYAGAAYATSGSALYSQHARSNFQMGRLRSEEIRELFAPAEVSADQASRQQVVRLTHGRLSHGTERADVYLLMGAGTLKRVQPRGALSVPETLQGAALAIIPAIDRLHEAGVRVSVRTLEADEAVLGQLATRARVRTDTHLLLQAGYLQHTGSTSARDLQVTEVGRGASRRETSKGTEP